MNRQTTAKGTSYLKVTIKLKCLNGILQYSFGFKIHMLSKYLIKIT